MSSPAGWQGAAYFAVVMPDEMFSAPSGFVATQNANIQSCADEEIWFRLCHPYRSRQELDDREALEELTSHQAHQHRSPSP
jgi:hypothetical protein